MTNTNDDCVRNKSIRITHNLSKSPTRQVFRQQPVISRIWWAESAGLTRSVQGGCLHSPCYLKSQLCLILRYSGWNFCVSAYSVGGSLRLVLRLGDKDGCRWGKMVYESLLGGKKESVLELWNEWRRCCRVSGEKYVTLTCINESYEAVLPQGWAALTLWISATVIISRWLLWNEWKGNQIRKMTEE